jgi:hypothetical protein
MFGTLVILFVHASLLVAGASISHPAADSTTRDAAEQAYQEGSFAQALALYVTLSEQSISTAEKRWVDFRLADCGWRALAATEQPDRDASQRARNQLQAIVERTPTDARDLVWAEAHESIADYEMQPDVAWAHYNKALDWWAGSSDIATARQRYLAMVWRVANNRNAPRSLQGRPRFRYARSHIPVEVLDNALSIAESVKDRASLNYLIATRLKHERGDWFASRRVARAYDAALAGGRQQVWHDSALFEYGQWLEYGPITLDDTGVAKARPDYIRAVELYRELLQTYAEGESRHVESARRRVAQITEPSLELRIERSFRINDVVTFGTTYRNVNDVDFEVIPVDLVDGLDMTGHEVHHWINHLDLHREAAVRQWRHDTQDAGDHQTAQHAGRIKGRLSPGAYVLQARAGGLTVRDLILVTDTVAILKTSGSRAILFLADAMTGDPRPGMTVELAEHYHNDGQWHWRTHRARTGDDGLADIELTHATRRSNLLATATGPSDDSEGSRQAFCRGSRPSSRRQSESWKIYAFTDRPAYRPGETVQWKCIARTYDGRLYGTPANATLRARVLDPKGAVVYEKDMVLSEFGSATDQLSLPAERALGSYRVEFRVDGRSVGGSALFRLEEFKLPEYQVTVQPAQDDGHAKLYRCGDRVELEVLAEYYFGGPVADASVTVVVKQSPYHRPIWPRRKFPWLDSSNAVMLHRWHGQTQITELTGRTDATGRWRGSFATPADDQEYEYHLEARVVDASRREIIGLGRVRVTRQQYTVQARADRNVCSPGDQIDVEFKAVDANDRPVQTRGRVIVERVDQRPTWIGPAGRVNGETTVPAGLNESIAALRKQGRFPGSDFPGWHPGDPHEEVEVVSEHNVDTDSTGRASIRFAAPEDGHYRVRWISRDADGVPVRANTVVWVAEASTRELGYRRDGIQIIVDQDTVKAGDRVAVMLVAAVPDRHVLFTVEAEEFHRVDVVHMSGTVHLMHLDVTEDYVPNVYLDATLVHAYDISSATQQVLVPPVRQFLDVAVISDRPHYGPGEIGQLNITVRDHSGKPAVAEVALAVTDEAVTYIQADYAGDPRAFYYDRKRRHRIRKRTMLEGRPFSTPEEQNELDVLGRAGPEADAGTALMMSDAAPAPATRSRKSRAKPAMEDYRGRLQSDVPGSALGNESTGTVEVRSNFAGTALWMPGIVTDEHGQAQLSVTFPDNLTRWNVIGRAATTGTRVGMGQGRVTTRRPLIVNIQSPRFAVVGDEVVVSAVVHNNTDEAVVATVHGTLSGAGGTLESRRVDVAPHGQRSVDWMVTPGTAGTLSMEVRAESGAHADAMRHTLPIHDHGLLQRKTLAGKVARDATLSLSLPERRAGSTTVTIRVTPRLELALLDALPYLVHYPYGCTEQTLSRFIPAVAVRKSLIQLGVTAEEIDGRLFGGVDPAHAAETHPLGGDEIDELDKVITAGLMRLYDSQHTDGGWGWWKRGDSDPYMTAYVVWGLAEGRALDLAIRSDVLARSVDYLNKHLVDYEHQPDLQAWCLHALAVENGLGGDPPDAFQAAAFETLWLGRDQLNAFGKALLALSAHYFGDAHKAEVLVRNLENGVIEERRPDRSIIQPGVAGDSTTVLPTARWGKDRLYRRWSEGGIEATAFALRAIAMIAPDHRLVEPAVYWLVKNRRAAQWTNTRDTAAVILTLLQTLDGGEPRGEVAYVVELNGEIVHETTENSRLLDSTAKIHLQSAVKDSNTIRIRGTADQSPLYYTVTAEYYSLEEPVQPTGHELFVSRRYDRLIGRPTLLKGVRYDSIPMAGPEARMASGDRVTVTLLAEAKNDLEYLIFEDLKPAGFEAVELRSGRGVVARRLSASGAQRAVSGQTDMQPEDYAGATRTLHAEWRDRHVALFADKLSSGYWEIRYTYRAETPGRFHGMPVVGQAMYVPEIRGNGAEQRVIVNHKLSE